MTDPQELSTEQRLKILESDREGRGWRQLLLFASLITGLLLAGTWVQTQNARSIARERVAREASEHAREASERAFCGIIILLDNAWHATPPTTPSGRELAAAVANARVVNHCPERGGIGK